MRSYAKGTQYNAKEDGTKTILHNALCSPMSFFFLHPCLKEELAFLQTINYMGCVWARVFFFVPVILSGHTSLLEKIVSLLSVVWVVSTFSNFMILLQNAFSKLFLKRIIIKLLCSVYNELTRRLCNVEFASPESSLQRIF